MSEGLKARATQLAKELMAAHNGHSDEGPTAFSEAAAQLLVQQTEIKRLTAALAERDAKLATLEKQEYCAILHDDGYWTWNGAPPYKSSFAGWRTKVYAASGAAPVPVGHRLVSVEALTKWRAAFADELAAWDIDPPLHHVLTSHDEISAILAAAPKEPTP